MAGVNMPEKKDSTGQIFQAVQSVKSIYDMSKGSGSPSGPVASGVTTPGMQTSAVQRRLDSTRTY